MNKNNPNLFTNDNNLPVNNTSLPTNDDSDRDSLGGSSGYESDENRAYHDDPSEALIEALPNELPDSVLREYIRHTREIVRNPEDALIEDRQGKIIPNDGLIELIVIGHYVMSFNLE